MAREYTLVAKNKKLSALWVTGLDPRRCGEDFPLWNCKAFLNLTQMLSIARRIF
jgi:hypothetical protein